MKHNPSTSQDAFRKLEAWQNPNIESCERRAKRYAVRCDCRLICEAPGSAGAPVLDQIVQIRDVSRTGAGLLCSVPIESGSRWRLHPIVNGVALAALPVFCRYCRKVDEDVYLVGVEFGIEASTLIALGVSPADLQRDETAGGSDVL
jgi:hypothetical protein